MMPQSKHPPASDSPAASDVYEHIRCNCCSADDAEIVFEARHADMRDRDLTRVFRASGDELLIDRLVRCRRCGLEYVSPRLRGSLVVDAYASGDDELYVSQMPARERTFADALARIEALEPARGRLLDVGAAAGGFLASARARGWEVEGCEPNRWLVNWAATHYRLLLRPGSLLRQRFEPQSFDVVTLWDVIEHTPDPSAVVARIRTLLRPGGLLVVNYPDRGSWIARLLGRRWPFLSSVHLFYFNRRTMARLLASHGFEIVRVRPHVQRLELDYLLSRAEVVSAPLSRVVRRAARVLGLSRWQIPYWIGQTFVAARLKANLMLVCGAGHDVLQAMML
jgi:2-polyprenyl-3-methyl-5-hydroxy-6-metoxy-1,4-benzoquinol methylase